MKSYLTAFYNNELTSAQKDKYEKFTTLERYLEVETLKMREQIKGLLKNMHLYWVIWCIVMMKAALEKESDEPEKLMETLNDFYVPYADYRLKIYEKMEWRI